MTSTFELTRTIETQLQRPLSEGWNILPGVTVKGNSISVDPTEYFFRYEDPTWLVCEWDAVRRDLLGTRETESTTLEQQVLDYITINGRRTTDGGQVLRAAESVYEYVFRVENLDDADLTMMGVTPEQLRILQEMGTVMALNRVELSGHISNVGPAWFFPLCSEKVFGLSKDEAEFIDDLYHSTFFNEPRRVESVLAHAAIGGRLVHGCQSTPCQSGGSVVPYGTDIAAFKVELGSMKGEWMDQIEAL